MDNIGEDQCHRVLPIHTPSHIACYYKHPIEEFIDLTHVTNSSPFATRSRSLFTKSRQDFFEFTSRICVVSEAWSKSAVQVNDVLQPEQYVPEICSG